MVHIVDSAFLWKSKNEFLLYVLLNPRKFLGINKFSTTNYPYLQYYYVKKQLITLLMNWFIKF